MRGEAIQGHASDSAVESRIGADAPVSHPSMLWMVEHSTELLAKYLVGNDGKTTYARTKGKPFRLPIAEFGEVVVYKKLQRNKEGLDKISERTGMG